MCLPIFDLERSKHRLVVWSLPTIAVTIRDCLWPIVVVALVAGWGIDRWQARKQSQAEASALAEARVEVRVEADNALRRELRLNELLRDEREVREALVEQHEADMQQITKLGGQISLLQADLPASRSAPYTAVMGPER
jgi:hypothetical protein